MTETDMEEFAKSLIGKSPYEIYKAIRDLDKEKGEGSAMAALHQSKEFGNYCSQQLRAFLDDHLALTKRDAQNIDKWWLFSSNDFSLEEIQKADAKVQKDEYIRSERYLDFDNNKIFKLFKENIPDIQDEMDMPLTENSENIRISERQKIADFVRFVAREKSQLIKDNDWQTLINAFQSFPNSDAKFLTKRYDQSKQYNIENPQKQKSEQEAFYGRILFYRLDDICKGTWKPSAEEVKFWQNYLQDEKFASSSVVQETLQKLALLKQEYDKQSQAAPQQEQSSAAKDSAKNMPENTAPVDTQNLAEPKQDKPQPTTISFLEEEDDEHTHEQNLVSQEIVSHPQNQTPEAETADKPNVLNVDEIENAEPALTRSPTPQAENIASGWKTQSLSSWQDWGKKNNKIVQEYKPAQTSALAFKVFDNAEKAQTGEFDADITYRRETDVVVRGYSGNVPSDEVFAAIVAQAKKNGPEICFGDIKNNIFKAKLMLACLNDPDVKMVNPPRLSELTDLPEELKAKLAEKMPRPSARAQERLQELKNVKNGRPRTDSRSKVFADRGSAKSADRPYRRANLDNNSGERRPRNGNTSLPRKRDNQYE